MTSGNEDKAAHIYSIAQQRREIRNNFIVNFVIQKSASRDPGLLAVEQRATPDNHQAYPSVEELFEGLLAQSTVDDGKTRFVVKRLPLWAIRYNENTGEIPYFFACMNFLAEMGISPRLVPALREQGDAAIDS